MGWGRGGGENREGLVKKQLPRYYFHRSSYKSGTGNGLQMHVQKSTHWQGFSDWTPRESAEGPDEILEQACVPDEEHLRKWEVGMGG